MKGTIKKAIKKSIYSPENVGGACMTGRILNEAEAKKVTSFLSQYKAKKKSSSKK
jgi:hypothetical protein